MTNIEWTVENEIQLFYAMMNHKPIGINKHFQMMAIHDKLTSSLNCELYAKEIWKKLETLYDLQALDESDKLPFPNNEEEFCLPQETFAPLLEDRLQNGDDDSRSKVKHNSKKEDSKEEFTKKDKSKELDEEDEEREIQRRTVKRIREPHGKKNSPSPAPPKRRR